MNEVIKYTPVSLWAQKMNQVELSEVHLFKDHLRFYFKFYADEPKDINDLDLGWDENVFNYFDYSITKHWVVGVELWFSVKNKAWYVSVIANGTKDINLYVKKQSEAQEIYDKLYNYLFEINA